MDINEFSGELKESPIPQDLILLDELRIHLGKINSEFRKIMMDQFLAGIFKNQDGRDEVQDYFIDKIPDISAIITGLDGYKERLKNYPLIHEALPAKKINYEAIIRLCGVELKAGKNNFLEMKEKLQSKIGDEKYQEGIDAYKKMAESFFSAFTTLREYTEAFDSINHTSHIKYLQKVTDIEGVYYGD